MKKVLVVLLVLFVGAGLFAQEITPFGSIRLDFGGKTYLYDGYTEGQYVFNANNSGTEIGLKLDADNVTAKIQYVTSEDYISGWGKVVLGDIVYLKVGKDHLPSAFWSPLGLFADSNWSIGATNIGKQEFFQIGYAGNEALDIHVGAANVDTLTTIARGGNELTPLIYLGAEYSAETFALGLTATGRVLDTDDANFPLLITLHGQMGLSEAIAIGANVGFYLAPQRLSTASGLFAYGQNGGIGDTSNFYTMSLPKDTMAIEALLFGQFSFDPATIALTIGFINNLASEDKGGGEMALQAGLSGAIALSENFDLIPGVVFVQYLKGSGGADPALKSILKYGVSMKAKF